MLQFFRYIGTSRLERADDINAAATLLNANESVSVSLVASATGSPKITTYLYLAI